MTKKLKEQFDYTGIPERMSRATEDKLSNPEKNVYGNNPAMPNGTQDVQRLASIRFKQVVAKFKEATGIQHIDERYVHTTLSMEMLRAIMEAKRKELPFTRQLEELAVKAALQVTEADAERYNIISKLTSLPNEIDTSNFNFKPKEDEEPEGEEEDDEMEFGNFDVNELTDAEKFELEKHKRHFINGLIQGASKKGHYIFQSPDIKEELDRLDPTLYGVYLKAMALNDYFYFTMEDMIDQASQQGTAVGGKEETEADEEGKITIKAQGFLFPILCHEVIKGIEEAYGHHGLPKDPDMADRVMGQTDILSNESITLKIGPQLVQLIRNLLPDEMFDEENFGIKPFFLKILYEIPPKEFLKLMKMVVSKDDNDNVVAQNKFKEIFTQALAMKQRYNQKRSAPVTPPINNDDNDIDWDALGSLGIGRPTGN